jgi:hypothetical protein
MKSFLVPLAVVVLAMVASWPAGAQYKAPSQYFRKDSPGVPGRPGTPSAPGTAPTTPGTPARPAATDKPKFKDVTVNSQFFFQTDTNRAFPWTKVTATTAKNAQGVTRAINGETLIRK